MKNADVFDSSIFDLFFTFTFISSKEAFSIALECVCVVWCVWCVCGVVCVVYLEAKIVKI